MRHLTELVLHRRSLAVLAGLALLLLGPRAAFGLQKRGPSEAALRAGRAAREAGRLDEAAVHLQRALGHRPFDLEVLEELLAVSEGDGDAQAAWAHELWAAGADDAGRFKPARGLKALLPSDPHVARRAAKRAAAVEELARFAAGRAKKGEKRFEELLVADWARRLARDLALEAQGLHEKAHELAAGFDVPRRLPLEVIDDVEAVMSRTLAGRDRGLAMRAARLLNAFVTQASFEDLRDDPPRGVERYRGAAGDGLRRARSLVTSEAVARVWTVDELDELDPLEAETFTRLHDSFAHPGLAISPEGFYRVESDCGYETLLGSARTVELHHERLAGWYGEDPFVTRTGVREGTLRVVTDGSGMEAESTPYWWAGGFQSGDLTVVRFACSTIESLGRTLTHELTHRFDGALYPGLPAWLSEGRAVWTGAAYSHADATEFEPRHANFGTIQNVWIDGFCTEAKLEELLSGELEDYRDNYTAGYTLYVFLNTWEEGGARLFEDALETFMLGCSDRRKDPLDWFVACFADGKDGRPADLAEFATTFETFAKGFYWLDPADWLDRYVERVEGGGRWQWVYDEPTWVWTRRPVEPFFGQEQARLAAELLWEANEPDAALGAFVWALWVDGWDPFVGARALALAKGQREREAAWALAQGLGQGTEPAPFLASLSKTRAYLDELEEAAADYREAGLEGAASVLAADRERLAERLGVECSTQEFVGAGERYAFNGPARALGASGWRESDLVGFEDRREAGLWFVDDAGNLHVGRAKARTGTGSMDRTARHRDAFAHSVEWVPRGRYTISTRVQLTTSFIRGAVVIGHDRRDRNVRVKFEAGDYLYATGTKDEATEIQEVNWSVDGLRQREGGLNGAAPSGIVSFDQPLKAFRVELRVDGPSMEIWIDDQYQATFQQVNGAPIEGHIGFATGFGAVQVEDPLVQRHDRARVARPVQLDAGIGDLGHTPFDELEGKRVEGFEPGPNGSIVLWVPAPKRAPEEEFVPERAFSKARRALRGLGRLVGKEDLTQRVSVVVPAALLPEDLEQLRSMVEPVLENGGQLLLHPFDGLSLEGRDAPADDGKRWVLFVDPVGVVRVTELYLGAGPGLSSTLQHWVRVFRDFGRPPRDLPPLPEPVAEEAPEGGDE